MCQGRGYLSELLPGSRVHRVARKVSFPVFIVSAPRQADAKARIVPKEVIVSRKIVTDVEKVEIFEPPLCCPTGMCGPVQDQSLLDLLETVRSLEGDGVRVSRYQPGSHPAAFKSNSEVMEAVRKSSTSVLPITVVNGRVVKSGAYPSLGEIRGALKSKAR